MGGKSKPSGRGAVGGREGELFKKMQENNAFVQKNHDFFASQIEFFLEMGRKIFFSQIIILCGLKMALGRETS